MRCLCVPITWEDEKGASSFMYQMDYFQDIFVVKYDIKRSTISPQNLFMILSERSEALKINADPGLNLLNAQTLASNI